MFPTTVQVTPEERERRIDLSDGKERERKSLKAILKDRT